jgi:acetyltransferase-like isoleucine patch superfamily enzyme
VTTTFRHRAPDGDAYGFHRVVGDRRSALSKYQAFMVGEPGILPLVKYELLQGMLAFIPGAAGILLRHWFYPLLLAHLGSRVAIGRSVTLRHPAKISIGAHSIVDDYAVLSAQGDADSAISLGERVLIGRNTVLKTRGGTVRIGDDADVGQNCRIGTTQTIEIGRHVLIGAFCCIGAGQHAFSDPDTPIVLQGQEPKGGVRIGDDVWLGVHAVVLDGVQIGAGSIIGAGAVVTRDIPERAIACGVPARVVGERD